MHLCLPWHALGLEVTALEALGAYLGRFQQVTSPRLRFEGWCWFVVWEDERGREERRPTAATEETLSHEEVARQALEGFRARAETRVRAMREIQADPPDLSLYPLLDIGTNEEVEAAISEVQDRADYAALLLASLDTR